MPSPCNAYRFVRGRASSAASTSGTVPTRIAFSASGCLAGKYGRIIRSLADKKRGFVFLFEESARESSRRSSTRVSSSKGQGVDVDFPKTYEQAVSQAYAAVSAGLQDGLTLQEVEFPPTSLDSVCGDEEGSIEMDANLRHTLGIGMLLLEDNKDMSLLFPDRDEMKRGTDLKEQEYPNSYKNFRTSFLTTPSIFGDVGLDLFKEPIAGKIDPESNLFVIAYPSYNVNEMLTVEELHAEVNVNVNEKEKDNENENKRRSPIVVINGELDRFRSGYYPSLFYPKIAEMSKAFIPQFEAVYYIHNFKGRNPGVLFRKYPGDWQVHRRDPRTKGVTECVHRQSNRPTLKEVYNNFFA